jgi:hypothetical protein
MNGAVHLMPEQSIAGQTSRGETKEPLTEKPWRDNASGMGSIRKSLRPWLLSGIVLLASTEAFAGEVAWNLSVDQHQTWLWSMPDRLTLDPPGNLELRNLDRSSVALGGSNLFLGVGAHAGLVVHESLLIPLLSARIGMAVGPSTAVVSAVDGTMVEAYPWTAGYFVLQLPGLGARVIDRRWAIHLAVQPGVAVTWMKGSLAAGVDTLPVGFTAASFSLRARLDVCYRVDPTHRACLAVEPNLYEWSLLSGATLGFRWEIGE